MQLSLRKQSVYVNVKASHEAYASIALDLTILFPFTPEFSHEQTDQTAAQTCRFCYVICKRDKRYSEGSACAMRAALLFFLSLSIVNLQHFN